MNRLAQILQEKDYGTKSTKELEYENVQLRAKLKELNSEVNSKLEKVASVKPPKRVEKRPISIQIQTAWAEA